ncbi:hypothetical protein OG723_05950 [Streptomyces sp. NBC_01278]|uniref:hypothetical protein n=1 Tax=Streptomyces sp. NBC_01278 TaxID=2903809 RepID=UPI002E302500|nr:hypothetical protein [Streptomyces sp. NBC_01278]
MRLKTIAPNAFTALFTDPQAREGLDMFPETYYDSITDPMDLLSNFQTGAFQNYAGYSDPAYDDLVSKARAEYDPARRTAAAAQLQKKAADQVLWIPVAEWPTMVALFMTVNLLVDLLHPLVDPRVTFGPGRATA